MRLIKEQIINNMKIQNIIITLSLLALLNACTKDETSSDSDYDIAVVETFLEPGREISVQLSKMIPRRKQVKD